ncbi:glycoside hydrolase family 127 protein [Fodinicola acaciae]|uniref:glycoside hydrolase family 127 protein n=1 Tax=Fodinicola acaciae TaxID=2681555 RepID=UPI0013D400A7|nr:beta-L-arabinofuranosidase domain-containing protein [Fodinicola acaciae]
MAALRPAGGRIAGGFWADRQRANREVSIPDGVVRLDRAGNLANLRLAAGRATGPYQGDYPFQDSDVHKWLEAAGWELGRADDAVLRSHAEEIISLLADAQQPDGYLDSYYQVVRPEKHFEELAWGHELYCAGHLIQAGIAHARATGDTKLLDLVRRVADHLDAVFGADGRDGVDGHPEIETALVELFRQTGERRYLDLAGFFVDRRGHGLVGGGHFGAGYFQDHVPVRQAFSAVGHAVRQLYLNAGVTDLALETGDRELAGVMVRQWEEMVATKTYLTGGLGAHHSDEAFGDAYELPSERAYCETCAAIASIQWSWRMLLLTGESRYADLMERTLFNGFAAGVSLDGRTYFYVNPLQVRDDHFDSGADRETRRTPWYKCACCPPNIMRLLSTVDHYFATTDATGVQLHQYGSGDFGGVRVRTRYPWEGAVSVRITENRPEPWTLSLRVPHWCDQVSIVVNGDAFPVNATKGYVRVERTWSTGDIVDMEFAMPVRKTMASPRVDAVRGCVALERGPLVYCLESVDQPENVRLDDVRIDGDAEPRTEWRPELLGGVTTVAVRGRHVQDDQPSWWPYRTAGDSSAAGDEVDLVAVPYFAWANRGAGAMRVWIPT